MLVIETILAFGWLVSWRAPETLMGRWLHRHIVAPLAARLDRITRGQVLVALLVAAMILGAMWLGRDAPRILALASPDLVLLLGSVEIGLYIDAALTAVLTWSAVRTLPLLKIGRRGQPRRLTRRERRPARAHHHPNNDNEDRAGRLLQAA